MVEEVESIRLQLQIAAFSYLELLVYTEVDVYEAGAHQSVASQCAITPPLPTSVVPLVSDARSAVFS